MAINQDLRELNTHTLESGESYMNLPKAEKIQLLNRLIEVTKKLTNVKPNAGRMSVGRLMSNFNDSFVKVHGEGMSEEEMAQLYSDMIVSSGSVLSRKMPVKDNFVNNAEETNKYVKKLVRSVKKFNESTPDDDIDVVLSSMVKTYNAAYNASNELEAINNVTIVQPTLLLGYIKKSITDFEQSIEASLKQGIAVDQKIYDFVETLKQYDVKRVATMKTDEVKAFRQSIRTTKAGLTVKIKKSVKVTQEETERIVVGPDGNPVVVPKVSTPGTNPTQVHNGNVYNIAGNVTINMGGQVQQPSQSVEEKPSVSKERLNDVKQKAGLILDNWQRIIKIEQPEIKEELEDIDIEFIRELNTARKTNDDKLFEQLALSVFNNPDRSVVEQQYSIDHAARAVGNAINFLLKDNANNPIVTEEPVKPVKKTPVRRQMPEISQFAKNYLDNYVYTFTQQQADMWNLINGFYNAGQLNPVGDNTTPVTPVQPVVVEEKQAAPVGPNGAVSVEDKPRTVKPAVVEEDSVEEVPVTRGRRPSTLVETPVEEVVEEVQEDTKGVRPSILNPVNEDSEIIHRVTPYRYDEKLKKFVPVEKAEDSSIKIEDVIEEVPVTRGRRPSTLVETPVEEVVETSATKQSVAPEAIGEINEDSLKALMAELHPEQKQPIAVDVTPEGFTGNNKGELIPVQVPTSQGFSPAGLPVIEQGDPIIREVIEDVAEEQSENKKGFWAKIGSGIKTGLKAVGKWAARHPVLTATAAFGLVALPICWSVVLAEIPSIVVAGTAGLLASNGVKAAVRGLFPGYDRFINEYDIKQSTKKLDKNLKNRQNILEKLNVELAQAAVKEGIQVPEYVPVEVMDKGLNNEWNKNQNRLHAALQTIDERVVPYNEQQLANIQRLSRELARENATINRERDKNIARFQAMEHDDARLNRQDLFDRDEELRRQHLATFDTTADQSETLASEIAGMGRKAFKAKRAESEVERLSEESLDIYRRLKERRHQEQQAAQQAQEEAARQQRINEENARKEALEKELRERNIEADRILAGSNTYKDYMETIDSLVVSPEVKFALKKRTDLFTFGKDRLAAQQRIVEQEQSQQTQQNVAERQRQGLGNPRVVSSKPVGETTSQRIVAEPKPTIRAKNDQQSAPQVQIIDNPQSEEQSIMNMIATSNDYMDFYNQISNSGMSAERQSQLRRETNILNFEERKVQVQQQIAEYNKNQEELRQQEIEAARVNEETTKKSFEFVYNNAELFDNIIRVSNSYNDFVEEIKNSSLSDSVKDAAVKYYGEDDFNKRKQELVKIDEKDAKNKAQIALNKEIKENKEGVKQIFEESIDIADFQNKLNDMLNNKNLSKDAVEHFKEEYGQAKFTARDNQNAKWVTKNSDKFDEMIKNCDTYGKFVKMVNDAKDMSIVIKNAVLSKYTEQTFTMRKAEIIQLAKTEANKNAQIKLNKEIKDNKATINLIFEQSTDVDDFNKTIEEMRIKDMLSDGAIEYFKKQYNQEAFKVRDAKRKQIRVTGGIAPRAVVTKLNESGVGQTVEHTEQPKPQPRQRDPKKPVGASIVIKKARSIWEKIDSEGKRKSKKQKLEEYKQSIDKLAVSQEIKDYLKNIDNIMGGGMDPMGK